MAVFPTLNREFCEQHVILPLGIYFTNSRYIQRGSAMSQHEREKLKLQQRVRKLRGQLDALDRALTGDEDCGDQLMLLAAVRGGINSLMGEVLEDHIRFHLTAGSKEQIAPELAEDLIDLGNLCTSLQAA
jgi:DNA-binding FrmR family transcriptional regulator